MASLGFGGHSLGQARTEPRDDPQSVGAQSYLPGVSLSWHQKLLRFALFPV